MENGAAFNVGDADKEVVMRSERSEFFSLVSGKCIDLGTTSEDTIRIQLYLELIEAHSKAEKALLQLRDELVESEMRKRSKRRRAA